MTCMIFSPVIWTLLLGPSMVTAATNYTLSKDHSGSNFFSGWSFYGQYDNLTNGDVIFVNQSASSSLAYVNDAGRAIVKVDNTTTVAYNEKRDSVRLMSTDTYGPGSIFVMDAVHVPYGCSVWPAFWTTGSDWPANGEIDIFEGVNEVTTNQYALHTETGCLASNASTTTMTGQLTYDNCSTSANENSGCTVLDSNTNSYGASFAAAGGGVFAALYADTSISIWFFSRESVPSDLSNGTSVDPSGWGTPTAYYGGDSCQVSTFFGSQYMTLDITLCGDWAGATNVFSQTCTGTCYTDYVLNASNYDTAYFEINSIRVFSDGSSNSTNSSNSSSNSSGSGRAFPMLLLTGLALLSATVLAM